MICPNCGRRNSTGATFCSRCHQRLPLVNKIGGNQRRAVIVEPRGGGGSAAVVLAVALLAGFLFIGGAAAIYLSQPPGSADPTDVAFASGSPTLPPFVQTTPSPAPTPSPTFILLPSDSPSFGSFSPLPTDTTGFPTPQPTNGQITPGPTAAQGVVARFACNQIGTKMKIICSDNSTGPVTTRQWTVENGQTSTEKNPTFTFLQYGNYQVTLVVNGPSGPPSFKQHDIAVNPPPSPTPTPTETPTATPSPSPAPTTTPCAGDPPPSPCPES